MPENEEMNGNRRGKTMAKPKIVQAPRLNAMLVANLTKRKTAGMEPLPTRKEHGYFRPTIDTQIRKRIKKLVTPRLRFGETVDARAYSTEDPPTTCANDTTVECNGTPTEDWLRQQALASIRRPLPQPEKEESYAQDKDYRDDSIHIIPPVQFFPNTKDQAVSTNAEPNKNAPDDILSPQSTEVENFDATKEPIFPDNFPASLN